MKKFTQNNESFICQKCGKKVLPHPSSSRDHCNFCLYSKHEDINPGDRLNKCQGLLKPISLELKSGKEKIIYKCNKCHALHKNITAPDDNREEVIRLVNKGVY